MGTSASIVKNEVRRFANIASFPPVGNSDAVYIDNSTGVIYSWDGAAYQPLKTSHDWDGHTGTADQIPFNTALPKPAYAEGLFYYDKDERAFVGLLDESEITQQIGREFYRRVRNNSGATIVNGKPVYQSGAETGGEGRALIGLADNTDPIKENVIGVATHDIENGSYGYITVLGDVNDVDTSGYTAGQILYLSTAGTYTSTLPPASEFVVEVATVEIVDATTGRLNVNIKNRGRLTDFSVISAGGNFWALGLDITEHDPQNQTVDFTNGSYYINGELKNIATGGVYNLENGHASQNEYADLLVNYDHRKVVIYVDADEQIKSIAGDVAGKNQTSNYPALPSESVCIAVVEISRGSSPKDIKQEHISDCRLGDTVNQDERVKISPFDTGSTYLEDALSNNGNVTFTKEGADDTDQTIKADVDLSGLTEEAPIDGTQYARKDGAWESVSSSVSFTEGVGAAVKAGADGVWQTVVIPGAPANSLIQILVSLIGDNETWGVRKQGTTIERKAVNIKKGTCTVLVTTNGSGEVDLFTTIDAETDFYYFGTF